MSGGSSGRSGSGRAARGGRTKSGKPRPGTGGYGKRRLEGKGPTPPAHLRPGHPAQRRAIHQLPPGKYVLRAILSSGIRKTVRRSVAGRGRPGA